MAKGVETYEGMAVPLQPKNGFEIVQQSASTTDIVTITAGSATLANMGSFLVCQDSAGTVMTKITKAGHLNLKSYTTKATTGLVKGDLFLLWHNTVPRLAIAIDGTTTKYIRFKTKTIGRLTA